MGAAIFNVWTPMVSNKKQIDESNAYLFYAKSSGMIERRKK